MCIPLKYGVGLYNKINLVAPATPTIDLAA